MRTAQNDLNEILRLVPQWAGFLPEQGTINGAPDFSTKQVFLLFERVGPKSIYKAAESLGSDRNTFLKLLRDHYLLKIADQILMKNPTLRRFFQGRSVDREWQQSQTTSIAAELALKLDQALAKKLSEGDQAGFKVLLPAYIQTSANNAVIDFVKSESHWEKQTLQDAYLDSDQDDPREVHADDLSYTPENIVLSKEKVKYLNEFRLALEALFKRSPSEDLSLVTVDCIFGLGLSRYSQSGQEMTMRECCQKLSISGETQARQIARCQVLLDKGLDQIRQTIREKLPEIAAYRQQEVNVNSASRRDLRHQLGLTEGEVERLVANRQYLDLFELSQKAMIKPERLSDLTKKGAVAAKVPVDLNSCTLRDLVDILGVQKPIAQRLFSQRPLASSQDLVRNHVISQGELERLISNGAILRVIKPAKANLNNCPFDEFDKAGIVSQVSERLLAGRPYRSWAELEQYLSCQTSAWEALRNNFSLS